MRSILISGAAMMAVSAGAWLFAGGGQCAQSAAACDAAKAAKTSLVSTDAKACDTTVATKSASCTADKTSLVSTDAKACDTTVATKVACCTADKASLVSTDAKSCEVAATVVKADVKADGACCGDKADKTSPVSLEPAESGKGAKPLDAVKPLAGK